ncbi:MAG: ChbG/HpnK family deacetylase [Candidatus Omnitrophota bacterium]|nr:ChbG/HpnK family deacetylase [Candidatus Omnitrophota bacterium]
MRALIVNADDLGIHEAINEAVKRCYTRGAITGVSLMACGRCFREAVLMLRSLGVSEVGVHLTLTGRFRPCVEDISRIKNLLPDKEVFPGDYSHFFRLYSAKNITPEEIYLELSAQIKRVKDEGFEITHLDGHEHVHMFPGVMETTVTLAEDFGIPFIRIPLEPVSVIRKRFLIKDLFRYTGLRIYAGRAKKILSGTRFKTSNAFLGHFHSGRVDDDVLVFMMEKLGEGVTELAAHPGVLSDELLKEFPWYRNAQKEMDALISGKWRKLVGSGKIRLITHKGALA